MTKSHMRTATRALEFTAVSTFSHQESLEGDSASRSDLPFDRAVKDRHVLGRSRV